MKILQWNMLCSLYRPTGIKILESSLCLILNFLSISGNLIVCITVYKTPRLRTTTNIYILALALSDLLSAVCVMPLAAGVLITGRWIFGAPGCELHGFFSLFTLYMKKRMRTNHAKTSAISRSITTIEGYNNSIHIDY